MGTIAASGEVHVYEPMGGTTVPEIRAVVAEAFADDPLLQWVFPDDASRLDATAAWLGLFVDMYAGGGRIDLLQDDDGLAAVALWRLPEHEAMTRPPLPTVPGLLVAIVGAERAAVLLGGLGVLGELKPAEPYAYLHFLAVSPRCQRQGLGRRLVQHGCAVANAAGLSAGLETMNPDNLAFYRSVGFEVRGEVSLEPDGPQVWSLWRPLG